MTEPRRSSFIFARILGGIGRTMITAGVLILLFVAYQLWGTGIRTAQAQGGLEDDFAATLEAAETGGATGDDGDGTTTTSTTVDPASTTTSRLPATTAPPLPPELLPAQGEAAGQIVIPAIGIDWYFVEGVSVNDLKEGPGHYPETPLPGQAGNSAIAGHRTTYGAPFGNVDQLTTRDDLTGTAGDEITVITVQGTFRYEVRQIEIVSPSQVEVLGGKHWDFDGDPATLHNTLTLTACHPKYSARQRIVIAAELIGEPAPPTLRPEAAATVPAEFEDDLSGDRAGAWPAILWGLVGAAVWFLAWVVGRRYRRLKWPSYLIGLLPFTVALFFFFENFSRLLPANY